MNTLPVVIIGGGGHAAVVADCLRLIGRQIVGLVDPAFAVGSDMFGGIRCLGDEDALARDFSPGTIELANGIGSTGRPTLRRQVFEHLIDSGFHFVSVAHPAAIIAGDVAMGTGSQIMAGAILQPRVTIGSNVIVNTGAGIDHGCVLGDHTHVAPGATLSGNVVIGAGSHVGTAASVIQGITIGENCLIGAGVVVLHDVPSGTMISAAQNRVW